MGAQHSSSASACKIPPVAHGRTAHNFFSQIPEAATHAIAVTNASPVGGESSRLIFFNSSRQLISLTAAVLSQITEIQDLIDNRTAEHRLELVHSVLHLPMRPGPCGFVSPAQTQIYADDTSGSQL